MGPSLVARTLASVLRGSFAAAADTQQTFEPPHAHVAVRATKTLQTVAACAATLRVTFALTFGLQANGSHDVGLFELPNGNSLLPRRSRLTPAAGERSCGQQKEGELPDEQVAGVLLLSAW